MQGPHLPGYEIVRVLGSGAAATVYLARQLSLDRMVAVKHVRDAGSDLGQRERFLREARVLSSLAVPAIVAVYDLITLGDDLVIVMEHVPGGSLRDRLRAGPVRPAQAVSAVEQMATALEAARGSGVVHRDLKPANVLLTTAGECKVADFGIAKLLGERGVELTTRGQILGTPAYMSPEQALGSGAVDHRSDVYALGVIAYQMLVGRVPFEGTALAVVAAQASTPPPHPSTIVPGFPAAVEAELLAALAKQPGRRPQSAIDLAAGLRRAAQGAWPDLGRDAALLDVATAPDTAATGGTGPAATLRAAAATGGATGPASAAQSTQWTRLSTGRGPRRRRLRPAMVVAGLALAAAAALGVVLLRSGHTSRPLAVLGATVSMDPVTGSCPEARRQLVGHIAVTGNSGTLSYRWDVAGAGPGAITTTAVDIADDVHEVQAMLTYAPAAGGAADISLVVLGPGAATSAPFHVIDPCPR